MRQRYPGRHRLLAIGAALAVLTATPSAFAIGRDTTAHPDNVAKPDTAAGSGARTVTLLTGDRVTVTPGGGGPDTVTVEGPNGRRADARITTQGGDTYVYPSATDAYVAAGLLDTNLFNVTRLIADGYDDARADGIPMIFSYGSKSRRMSAAASLPDGASEVRALTSIDSTALVADHSRAEGFWSALTAPAGGAASRAKDSRPALTGGIAKIWLDGKVRADLADSTAQIGAPEVWARGNTGKGVDVAVLDTGYDTGHPDLAAAVTSSATFVPDEDITDHVGHGTHVASTIAGDGAASGGKERGVAPGVNLHVGKVLDNGGSGQNSWIISGMEWAARDARARVVSMSLGSSEASDGTDPLSQAVNELSEETGTLFTIAAGNSGPGNYTVASPGAATDALTVGAVDSQDASADFSSRGPRLRDDAIKPEITAPGVDILAARSQYYSSGSGSYTTMSGTSMATPHVAGVAALVAAQHPDWTGDRIKDALVSTAAPTPANPVEAGGNGRVDAAAATTATVFADGTADFGIHSPDAESGAGADRNVDRTVEWRNDGPTAVTVDLAVDAPGAPSGVFTLADRQLVVPAGGTAATTVTAHLDRAPDGNRYSGGITATAGGTSLTRTLLSVSTREEDHHLRARITDDRGVPVSVLVIYQRQGDEYSMSAYSQGGVFDAIVPSGTYTVWTWVVVEGTHGESSAGLALLSAPSVEVVTKDAEVVLDGTKVRQTRLVTPRKSTDSDIRVDFSRSFADGSPAATEAHTVGDGFDSLWALPTAKPASGDLVYTARWRMQQPLLSLTSGGQDFDDLWIQPGSARQPDGDRTLDAVYAGDGMADDYASVDAKGKVSVIHYVPVGEDDDEDAPSPSDAQVKAAEKAGVALLVMVNDLNGRLYEPLRRTPITVVGLTRTEGEKLIARIEASRTGSVPARLVTHAKSEYLYDLVHSWQGKIPQDLAYAPKEKQLARVDVGFRNDPALEVDEFRYDIQPYLGVKIGGPRLLLAGGQRTDWVTADRNVAWMEEASAGIQSFQFSDLVGYPAGKTTDVQWFGPVERPRINRSQPVPQRTGDSVMVTVPGFGDSGHAGTVGPGTTSQETELYRGDTLVAGTPGYVLAADVPAGKGDYRLVTTTERTEGYPYSTATRTEWGFTSATPREGVTQQLPLVQIDYGVTTGQDGTADREAAFLVTPSHIPGVSNAAVRTDKVELSYDDGKTWRKATLSSSAKGALTHLDAPARAEFVSVRVHASDARGNTVTQTITRAFGLG
ncbi:S8 family serine peptidase [Streptomyces sp. AK02-01A]|uniref:S8 family serine peptidase n=1 Tax=Streptomyces sp. AK02-01A TaxID=3028648 RepID=UPI0029BC80D8|nr:S8 family serine peptidase [Streptomyces sp. AK02-01A]MDX3849185.1 S8 family serine peptidase [Streptomyces sp. AK02-01A]